MEFTYKPLAECLDINGIDLEQRAIRIAAYRVEARIGHDHQTKMIKEIKTEAAAVLREFADRIDPDFGVMRFEGDRKA